MRLCAALIQQAAVRVIDLQQRAAAVPCRQHGTVAAGGQVGIKDRLFRGLRNDGAAALVQNGQVVPARVIAQQAVLPCADDGSGHGMLLGAELLALLGKQGHAASSGNAEATVQLAIGRAAKGFKADGAVVFPVFPKIAQRALQPV